MDRYYREIEEKIHFLVKELSSIKYLQGSSDVVNDGAYEWEALCPEGKTVQQELYKDYVFVIGLVREQLEQIESPYLRQYMNSCDFVLDIIQQNTVLFSAKIQDVADEIKRQIDIQRFLVLNHA